MSYYMGDYRGDFYGGRGDPGIGSFFGGLAKSLVGAIPVVGPTLSRVGGAVGALVKRHPAAGAITGAAKSAGGAIARHPVLSAAGAAGIMGIGAGALAVHELAGGACPKGFHISKHHKGKAPHCVRNRHMNFCNPRALRRATRRLHSFSRHYRKVVGFVSPKKPKGRMYFKRRRKAA